MAPRLRAADSPRAWHPAAQIKRQRVLIVADRALISWASSASRSIIPVAWPIASKRRARRASASDALTGGWSYERPPGWTTW